jgi:hypothetical protein
MDTNDTIETARAFPDALIVPLHTDGWALFPPERAGSARVVRYARIWQTLAVA